MEEHRHKLLQNITELLRRTFPSQFVFPVLGHEDGQATNFRHLADLWQTWLPSEALTTFERGELARHGHGFSDGGGLLGRKPLIVFYVRL